MTNDDRELWRIGDIACGMVSCCSGAELQLRQVRLEPDLVGTHDADFSIVLRELYPTKSDLYERARDLEAEYRATGC
jgi:hypothetical protein